MPRRPHALRDCDETCNGCYRCYRATGETVCDWNCPHTADEHGCELEDDAIHTQHCDCAICENERDWNHGASCQCEYCRWERARDTAEEPCRD